MKKLDNALMDHGSMKPQTSQSAHAGRDTAGGTVGESEWCVFRIVAHDGEHVGWACAQVLWPQDKQIIIRMPADDRTRRHLSARPGRRRQKDRNARSYVYAARRLPHLIIEERLGIGQEEHRTISRQLVIMAGRREACHELARRLNRIHDIYIKMRKRWNERASRYAGVDPDRHAEALRMVDTITLTGYEQVYRTIRRFRNQTA